MRDTTTTTTKRSGLRRMVGTLALWQDRRRSRVELAQLSPYQLKDIGLVPGDMQFEAAKPFWRA